MSVWNLTVFNFIHAWSGRFVVADMAAIFFAEYLPYLLVLGFFILIFRQSGARRKLYLFAEGALAIMLARGIVAESLKLFYQVERPFSALGFSPLIAASGWSFPSGHMAWFFALAVVVWCADREWGAWYVALTFVMGVARIYAGVHWPFDILAGVVVGVASGWAVHALLGGTRMALWPVAEKEKSEAVS